MVIILGIVIIDKTLDSSVLYSFNNSHKRAPVPHNVENINVVIENLIKRVQIFMEKETGSVEILVSHKSSSSSLYIEADLRVAALYEDMPQSQVQKILFA